HPALHSLPPRRSSDLAHLKDETDLTAAIAAGTLPAVSFVKPAGIDNEHPNYTDVLTGENHVAALVAAIKNSALWKDTAIIITYRSEEHTSELQSPDHL